MLHDDYLCLVEFGKQQIKEDRRKFNRKTWKQRQFLSEPGFVLRIAPPPVSRDRTRRVKMKKSINQLIIIPCRSRAKYQLVSSVVTRIGTGAGGLKFDFRAGQIRHSWQRLTTTPMSLLRCPWSKVEEMGPAGRKPLHASA